MAGSTDGTFRDSITTQTAFHFMSRLCDEFIEYHRRLVDAWASATRLLVDVVLIGLPPGPLKEWLQEQVRALTDYVQNELFPRLETVIRALCVFIGAEILPWLLATQTLREMGRRWAGCAEVGSLLAGDLSEYSVGASGKFTVNEWEGVGKDSYVETIQKQHGYAAVLADVPEGIGNSLVSVAQKMEDCALGMTITVNGISIALGGVIAAAATAGPTAGVGAVIGAIVAAVGAVMTIYGLIVGGIQTVKTMLDGAANEISQLDSTLNKLDEKNRGWPHPTEEVGGTGSMGGGKPLWDDGIE
jgi:hypothetical protein